MFTIMQNLSRADYWTMVFATLNTDQLLPVMSLAHENGYDYALFDWTKPDKKGKSSTGGDRHPMCSERIIVVYKRKAGETNTGFSNFFALRKRVASLQNSKGTFAFHACDEYFLHLKIAV